MTWNMGSMEAMVVQSSVCVRKTYSELSKQGGRVGRGEGTEKPTVLYSLLKVHSFILIGMTLYG